MPPRGPSAGRSFGAALHVVGAPVAGLLIAALLAAGRLAAAETVGFRGLPWFAGRAEIRAAEAAPLFLDQPGALHFLTRLDGLDMIATYRLDGRGRLIRGGYQTLKPLPDITAGARAFDSLARLLAEKYGSPADRGGSGRRRSARFAGAGTQILLSLEAAADGTARVDLVYEPAAAPEAPAAPEGDAHARTLKQL